MGLIASLKEFVIPLAVWLLVMSCFVVGLVRKAEWSVYFFAVLAPLPTLWYPSHQFVFGKDALDLLFFSAAIGMVLQGKISPATQGRLIIVTILYTYVSVWVVTENYGLNLPISLDNPVLSGWKNFAIMLSWFLVSQSLISSEAKARVLMNIFIGVLLFMCWREIAGFVAGSDFSWGRRASGPFWLLGLNSNHYGAFIAQAGLLALSLAAYEVNKRRKWLLFATASLSLYPLLYSYSRGAYVGFLAGLLVLGLLRYRLLLLLAGLALLMWDSVLPASVVDRITMTEGEDGALEQSSAMRIVMWDLAKELFASKPLFGIGFQGFVFASADQPLHNVHNYYLQTAAEQGILGAVLLLAILLLGLTTGYKLWRKAESNFLRGLGLGLVAYTVCLVVVNVFGDRYSQLNSGAYYFLLLGVSVRMLRNSQTPVDEFYNDVGSIVGPPLTTPNVVRRSL